MRVLKELQEKEENGCHVEHVDLCNRMTQLKRFVLGVVVDDFKGGF